jgi:CsoR family transcriptional regulator, copper-sensing transcriptional repressor
MRVWDTGGGYAPGMSKEKADGIGEDQHEQHGPHGYSGDKQALIGRLRRIEGQIRGLQRMVDQDTYCIDVLTQISAAKSALQAVAVGLLEDHLAHCVVDAARQGDPSAKVKEASDAIARLVRS